MFFKLTSCFLDVFSVYEWKVASEHLHGATLWHHPITYVPSQDGIDNPTVKQLTNDDASGTLKQIF
jgi:hypothetical protein